ncbi:MAG: hydroxymethylglutaryl-CoA lyase [Flavobacteriales bacterium]
MEPVVQLIECPRDAMQGIQEFIPTSDKVRYINQLLQVGFDTIDFGSFVSEKAIPQMRDTREVLARLDFTSARSRLLAIVANARGADVACGFDEIHYVGYPFSVSETFQWRNTNRGIADSLDLVKELKEITDRTDKELVVYLSMGFGNPYGDPWNAEIVSQWCARLHEEAGVRIMALSDTIGSAEVDSLGSIFSSVQRELPKVLFGVHLHSRVESAAEKIQAAFDAGCRRFDGALMGFGGCPMAKDDLTGNMPMEVMTAHFQSQNIELGIDQEALKRALMIAQEIFPNRA